MTSAYLEAELSRVRLQEVEDPTERQDEVLRAIANRAALLERFFNLGATVSMNHDDRPFEGEWGADARVASALRDLAEEIVVGATWLEALREGTPATEAEALTILEPVIDAAAKARGRREAAAKGGAR